MKLGRTLFILWTLSLAVFIATGIVTLLAPDLFGGIAGLAIRFLLGYCGIIVVAQVYAAMNAIRQLFEEATAEKPVSFRILLR